MLKYCATDHADEERLEVDPVGQKADNGDASIGLAFLEACLQSLHFGVDVKVWSSPPCAEIDKKKCAGHRSTPIYEQSSAPPLKAPRGLQGGPLQSESIHSSLDIFKGSGHQKSESVFREFILRLELLSANYITTHLKLLSYSFECL